MNKYAFIIDENGIIDADSELKQSFDTVCNFGEATKQGQEIYLGIELKNKADKTVDNTISFSVVVNGKTYNLANGILLPLYKEETTKVKANNKTTAVKETKKNNNTTNKSSTSKSSTEKTTKFKYVAPVTQKGGNKYTAEDYTYDNEYENAETSSESPQILTEKNVNTRSTLSRTSKILIAVAVIFIAIGIGVIIYNSTKTQKAKKNEQTDEE
ncbi:MAG: hypothetical protein K2F65_02775 [Eubacterium sp.]|nr:hypothetical protein [Eubacterium sp.]